MFFLGMFLPNSYNKTKSFTGWWFLTVSTPLKNMKVSWDDEIPNIWKVIQNSMVPVTTNQ